jgi:hypothetical protein
MLDIDEDTWLEAVEAQLPSRFHEANHKAFEVGRMARCPTNPHSKEHQH